MAECQLPKLKTRVRFPSLASTVSRLTAAVFSVFFICLSGCVSVKDSREVLKDKHPPPQRKGVYHKVAKGETLWRIAKTYHLTIDDITTANNIPKVAQIERGQLLFIPGADAVREIFTGADDNQNEFIWPVRGPIIKNFRERQDNEISKGIGIKAKEGESVKASRQGTVVFADFLSGYGYTVIIDHADGFHSVYARNAKLLVKLNDFVLKDTAIAQVGRDSSRSAYLHFEIRKNTVEDNPLYYLP